MKTSTLNRKNKGMSQFIQLYIYVAFAIAMIFVTSCTTDEDTPKILPIAKFTTESQINTGESFDLINESSDADSYFWSFGDNNTSTQTNPSHVYQVHGTFTISLIATNVSGSDTSTFEITVNEVINPCEIVYNEKPANYLTSFAFCAYSKKSNIKYEAEVSDNIMTFYEPENADFTKPLVLLSPGGAWSSWSRTTELEAICTALALRGYAVAMVNYSILSAGENPGTDIWVKSAIDQRNAIKYFKKNAVDYNIDPNNIFIGGWSTGALISIYNALIDSEDIENFESESFKSEVTTALNKYEDYNLYMEYDHAVQGALLMFSWFRNENVFDMGDTPIMLINHKDAVIGTSTKVWGEFDFGGEEFYGFDVARDKALEAGYVDGETLGYIKMEGPVTMSEFASVEAMHLDNLNAISDFFYRNLQ